MRKCVLLLFLLPTITIAQTDSIRIAKEKKEIALEAKPVYVKATALILELMNDVELAKNGLISKKDVISYYNSTVGGTMGKQNSFSGVENTLKEKGDAYPQFLYLKEEARIAYLKAAEAKYDATH